VVLYPDKRRPSQIPMHSVRPLYVIACCLNTHH
jgi:hypothetical protein